MRVAFTIFAGSGWTGGVNYMENLLSALHESSESGVQAVLFAGEDADPKVIARLSPFLAEPPVISPVWNSDRRMRIVRMFLGFVLQRDYLAEREFKRARVDVVFQHAAWYGCRFRLPTLAWIADFQHKRLPAMFSKANYYWRHVGYWALSHCATRLMVSSLDAKRDCEDFYPRSIGRVHAVPFAVKLGDAINANELESLRSTYKLPEKFFFLPNQFWKHKNHLNLIEALRLIKESNHNVCIVASGNPKDGRNPEHPKRIFDLAKEYGLGDHFIFLGMIPFQHILPLMRLSAAVVNPSLFEGWSTSVEEAKAVGAPLILSDLAIHREQVGEANPFFDPVDPASIAEVLLNQWDALSPGPRLEDEQKAKLRNQQKRKQFALDFGILIDRTCSKGKRVRSSD